MCYQELLIFLNQAALEIHTESTLLASAFLLEQRQLQASTGNKKSKTFVLEEILKFIGGFPDLKG